MIVTLFLCALSGEVIGEVPQQSKKATAPEPIPGIARMNPYYLGISAAVLANDKKALSNYVNDLEKVASSHPENWMDAMCARLYVLEKLDDRDGFSQAMAELCAKKLPDKRSAERRLKYVTTTLLTLRLNQRAEWVKTVSDAIGPVLGPVPDPLLLLILKNRLANMPQYPAKAKLLADLIEKAAKSLQEPSNNHPLQSSLPSGMEELNYLSIRNHFSGSKFEPFISEGTGYLDKYGIDGRHAGEVFYLLLKTLNDHYIRLTMFGKPLNPRLNADWLQRWQQSLTAQKGGPWTKRIAEEWTKWESGAQMREELALQPRNNPKLQERLSLKLKRPTIKEFFNRFHTASGLHFTAAENIPEDRVVCDSLSTKGVFVWSLMDQIRNEVVSEGQWKPEMTGHQVTGYQLTGNLKPLPQYLLARQSSLDQPPLSDPAKLLMRYLLSIIPLLAVGGILLLVRLRRRAKADGAVIEHLDDPMSPSSA
jgi:hypothetical protein